MAFQKALSFQIHNDKYSNLWEARQWLIDFPDLKKCLI